MIALRRADAGRNDHRALVASQKSKGTLNRDDLLMELGRLQVAQARILAQLQVLEDSGMDARATESGSDAEDA